MCENTTTAAGAGTRADESGAARSERVEFRNEISSAAVENKQLRRMLRQSELSLQMMQTCSNVNASEITRLRQQFVAAVPEHSPARVEQLIDNLRDAIAFVAAGGCAGVAPIEAAAEAVDRWSLAIRRIRGE